MSDNFTVGRRGEDAAPTPGPGEGNRSFPFPHTPKRLPSRGGAANNSGRAAVSGCPSPRFGSRFSTKSSCSALRQCPNFVRIPDRSALRLSLIRRANPASGLSVESRGSRRGALSALPHRRMTERADTLKDQRGGNVWNQHFGRTSSALRTAAAPQTPADNRAASRQTRRRRAELDRSTSENFAGRLLQSRAARLRTRPRLGRLVCGRERSDRVRRHRCAANLVVRMQWRARTPDLRPRSRTVPAGADFKRRCG